MEAVVHTDIAEFAALTRERYEQDPVWNTVLITNVYRMTSANPPSEEGLVLVTLHEGDEIVGSVMRQPPRSLQVTDLPLPAVDLVVDLLRRIDPELDAVMGPKEISSAFAARWNGTTTPVMSNRLYWLGELKVPEDVVGTGRVAGAADASLLARWVDEFHDEALSHEPRPSGDELVRRAFSLGYGQMLWEVDGVPVAWATASPPLQGMSRIGPVYTPPASRRRGYGAAVTAAASRWAMAAGASHVVLFADLLNPVSNSVYQRIGFEAVSDWADYAWK